MRAKKVMPAITEDLSDSDRISVKELMNGKGLAKDIKKTANKAAKTYRKKVRPVVNVAAKATLPVVKTAIKTALPAALTTLGVPPAAVAPIAALGSELATEGLKAVLNETGVTEGLGLKHILPYPHRHMKPMPMPMKPKPGKFYANNLMGAGIDPMSAVDDTEIASQMRSKPIAAAAQMNLMSNQVRRTEHGDFEVSSIPQQMQSKPYFTGMNINQIAPARSGEGLYRGGYRGSGLYM